MVVRKDRYHMTKIIIEADTLSAIAENHAYAVRYRILYKLKLVLILTVPNGINFGIMTLRNFCLLPSRTLVYNLNTST